MRLNVLPLMDAIEVYICKANDDLEQTLADEGYTAPAEAVAAINRIEDSVAAVYDEQIGELLKQIEDATGVENFADEVWPEIRDEADLRNALRDIFCSEFTDLLGTFTTNWMLDAAPDLAVDNRITKPSLQFVKDWSEELANLMQLSSNEQIENILEEAVSSHLSVQEVSQLISDSGIRAAGYQSRRTAITEVLRTESYSQLEYMRQDPAVEKKGWFHTGAHKNEPRPNHVAMSGQQVPVEEPFELTGRDGARYYPMCPRDTCLPASESINCHCIMKSVRNKSVLGMSAEERREMRQKYMDEVDAEWEEKMAAEAENKIDWPEKGEKISTTQFKEVMKYAREKGVRLSGFKQFDGNIQTVKELVDDVDAIAADFPLIKEGKKPVTILLDESIDSNDFAVTRNHVICINANAFRDTGKLAEEYQKLVDGGWFVKGTDYRSIIRHETGHVIANKYGLDGLETVKTVAGVTSNDAAICVARKELSEYAAFYSDGTEIISEVFSGAYSSGEKNKFALQVIESFGIIQERE